MKFITANKDKPFSLDFPHYAVHTPIGGLRSVLCT